MGQYQQWLSAQEVHQRLRVEKETLETELLYLRDRITILEQSVPEAENVILQALQARLQAQSVEGSSSGAQDEQGGLTRAQGVGGAPAYPALYSQMERGADMLAFFDKHGQTDPHLAAWRASEGGQEEREGHLVDEETRRLNESIQRWFVRWHRQLTGVERSEEARHD